MNIKPVLLVPVIGGALDFTYARSVPAEGSKTEAETLSADLNAPVAAFGLHVIVMENNDAN